MSFFDSSLVVTRFVSNVVDLWRSFEPERRAWVFAHILVPAIVAPFALGPLAPSGPLPSGDGHVAVAPLYSRMDGDGSVESHTGLAVMIDSNAPRFSVSVSTDKPEVLTSLSIDHLRNARAGFEVHPDSFGVNPSEIGLDSPIVVVAAGTPGKTAYLGTSQYPLEVVTIAGLSYSSLPLAVVLCAVFGIGLTAGTEHGSAQEHADKDEHEIIDRDAIEKNTGISVLPDAEFHGKEIPRVREH
jgi:hypothetical protein